MPDLLEGKSEAYREGFKQAQDAYAARYGITWPAGKAPKATTAKPSATMRQDDLPRVRHDQWREDAEPSSSTLVATGAARARLKMLQEQGGMQEDAAIHRVGLRDQTARLRRDAEVIAELEAREAAQRAEFLRKAADAGLNVRVDADSRSSAGAARARMQVRQDRYAFDPLPDGSEQHRADAADAYHGSSAAAARQRLYERGA